ncbi:MAG: hypothetical protein LBB65_06245 [Burkholderiales bacterium]|jgi:hypothetical protein|nr:hypothetical protein [Burkholderiales bacterium]
MIGDILGEVLGGVFRFIGRIFVELFFETLVQDTGFILLRLFRRKSASSDTACTIVGLLFWAGVVGGGIWLYFRLTTG